MRTPVVMLRTGRVIASILAIALVTSGCGAVPSVATSSPSTQISPSSPPALSAAPSAAPSVASLAPSPRPSAALDRVAGLRADIDALLDARDTVHPNGWHGMPRAEWVTAADVVKAKAPTLTDDQALVELVRLAAMPSWNGRDGHSGIFLTPGGGTHPYPIRLWQFSDGLVITAARAPYEDLVGSKVTAIGGHGIDEVMRLAEPLSPRDNPSSLLAFAPRYTGVSEILSGLGVIDRAGPATFSLVGRDGTARDVTIEPITVEEDVVWHSGQPLRLPPTDAPWLRDQAKTLWWSYLADSDTLFVQYNAVEPGIDAIADEILARAKEDDVARVVVDLRHNGGGDNTTMRHFEDVLRDPAINRPGRLVVLIGRLTFSAAANFATDLEQSSAATFAGEAMGGSPNLYGDARQIDLPSGGQSLFIATRYWERSTAADQRVTIVPDIAAELSSADYFAGRDPVLQAILDTPVAPG
jgi:hypothetical protein